MNINNNNLNNFALSMNLKQQLNHNKSSSTNNANLNFVKLNNNNGNNYDVYDQSRTKFSMKFFEKLNMNNNKNNKGIKYSNINDMNNNISNVNKLNNIKKDVMQIYNKEKKNLNNKNNEKQLINKMKGKKFIGLGNNLESKNNNALSSSYSNLNNINNLANSMDNNNKIGNAFNNDINTINLDKKNIKKKITKLNSIKIEKIPRNLSNPGNSALQMNKNSTNIIASPINKVNNLVNFNYNPQINAEQKNKTSIILKKNNNKDLSNININRYNVLNDNYNENENQSNNVIIDYKKLSITDIPAPSLDYNSHNTHNTKEGISNFFKNITNLSLKEKAFCILLKSPVVPLSSKIIFSRSTKNLKNAIKKKDIFLIYELYLNAKINNYEERQILHNEVANSTFSPTKIAEITLNFITSENEKQFNDNYVLLLNNKEDYNFIYYKNYIKVIYYIINESFEDEKKGKISDNRLLANLYDILSKKGYKKIKDYLFFVFITNNKKENIFLKNIDKINKLINDNVPKLLCFDESLKTCRFIVYSIYLIKEIVDYTNKIKNTIKIKAEEKDLIEKMKEKLEKFHYKYLK